MCGFEVPNRPQQPPTPTPLFTCDTEIYKNSWNDAGGSRVGRGGGGGGGEMLTNKFKTQAFKTYIVAVWAINKCICYYCYYICKFIYTD